MTAYPYIVTIFLAICLVSIFYWQIVQPVILKAVRFRLFARRDELRRLAITKKEHTSRPYNEVEGFICKTIAVIPSLNLLSFISFMIQHRTVTNDEYKRIRNEASEQLIQLMDKTVTDGIVVMLINSPIFTLFFALIALYLWIIGNGFMILRQAEDFIAALPTGSGIAQAA